ncbi:SufS family cysteine desulfurase [Blochmannia endosymbiont of Camponotus sp. C-003]|uniref:SufS family cysteine desulfurase n=1 Tax=unclassified Candidatus Blochmanniella TaxID=711328 RepID=UPI0020259D9D|nr:MULTISPECIES: SufS family cysteine desulfurase [unclassified Candidatus Blochmannia]URJ23453.1 SufS family cysteine desulfurase [Blochmannia endosymbiont of Camponotus sp. C-003]URJ28925.1 SufS family cysteine desulfurase [Blochmannia endosymbiont of Camponotus sp. C-046]
MTIYPIEKIRSDFPILNRIINQHPLTYLDNAASAQKPNIVIDSQTHYYRNKYAAVHRGIHTLSTESTDHMETVRLHIANFINASREEIVFVKSTTEAINLIANSWGHNFINYGDNIIISEMEHHANIIPWQILSKNKKIALHYIPLTPNGTLNISSLSKIINNRTRLLSVSHMSNVLGTINPLTEITNIARKKSNALILIDGAQGIVHQSVDVQKLDCDFYVFSGHKLYGPSGTGIMYGKRKLLQKMPPWIVGGGIVQDVSLTHNTTFIDSPWKFESGSPNISGIIGLGSAIEYINTIGIDKIYNHEDQLIRYAVDTLQNIPNLILYGPSTRVGIIAFNLGIHHSYDIGMLLNQYGIAIRTGHHCAIPTMNYFKVPGMCRASLAMYTNKEDIDRLAYGLMQAQHLLN